MKFHENRQRELVTAGDKSDALKAINKGARVQQTRAVLQKRRGMNDIYEREKAAGRQLKWSEAKLLVGDGDSGNFREVAEKDKHRELRIISWNVNGLRKKLDDVDFIDYIKQHDIILLSETWLSKRHRENLSIQGTSRQRSGKGAIRKRFPL